MEPSKAPEIFLKPYDPATQEARMRQLWDESGYANPDVCVEKGVTKPDAEPYSIVLPPPNVTGTLHMGHAAMLAIEDILIRHHRMRGYRTLWVPGTDHAAIATQSVVEKQVSKAEGKNRYQLGRKELVSRIEAFAAQSHDTIVNQLRAMGASLDWSREAFTLDEKRSNAVKTAFKRMYDTGLIYRGNRIVNWDPRGQTTISDDEIVYVERSAKLYTFRYSKDFPIPVATTRPETKVGDVAVAVHPDDARYKGFIGEEYDVVFCDVPLHIKIIADKVVDPSFGTGAVGVTPAHSMTDWAIAERHGLPKDKVVINGHPKMTNINGRLYDKSLSEAQAIIIDWLKTEGLLEKEEDVKQNVATAERTGGVIQPIPLLQWFVAVDQPIKDRGGKTLKELMLEPVQDKKINVLPEQFERVYFNWIENLRDWCISRQIWYGHRIPVWYDLADERTNCIIVASPITYEVRKGELNQTIQNALENADILFGYDSNNPEQVRAVSPITAAGARLLVQNKIASWSQIISSILHVVWTDREAVPAYRVLIDETDVKESEVQDLDTLDTWFSSGLWTFSTLGWPEETPDLKTYHPTSVLETGYDILFFWVARMILMSEFLIGDIPFHNVYLHGLVRDGQGRKMSKSLGNIIDPLVMIEKYGADATRLSLIIGVQVGNDLKLSEDRVRGYKHFANKLWNIARFVLENVQDRPDYFYLKGDDVFKLDDVPGMEWPSAFKLAKDVTIHLKDFRLDLAADKAYHYVWNTFADEILEECKEVLKGNDIAAKTRVSHALYSNLYNALKVLHPFMPYVTEAIWQQLPQKECDQLMVAKWPV